MIVNACSSRCTTQALGVLFRLAQRSKSEGRNRTFDIAAIITATVLPMVMGGLDAYAGLLQRLMFLIAYFWCGAEALTW